MAEEAADGFPGFATVLFQLRLRAACCLKPLAPDSVRRPLRASHTMSEIPSSPAPARKRCGCGNTKDAGGFCDGSHAKPAPAPVRKACGCGRTQDAQGNCDGSHAKRA